MSRHFQTFNEKELHQSPINKAAALIERIVINHPFVDGNKRTGYVVMKSFLIANGLILQQVKKKNMIL
ncbi:MAG: type II toxin-antitoxin system death-on-curing family toxin [Ginsengibacter sp.]